jgi:cobalt/nickel transport system permease protein
VAFLERPQDARGRVAPIERLDPRTRVLLAFGFACAVAVGAGPLRLSLVLAAAATLLVFARHPRALVRRRLAAVEGVVLLVVLTLPFTVPGTPLAAWGPWTVTDAGVARAVDVALRVNAIALAVLALLGSLDPAAFGRALAQLRVPPGLVQTLAFATRYLAVLERELQALLQAMRARGFRPRSDAHTYRSLGFFVGALVIRAFDRSERVLGAMRCRGFDGRFPAADASTLPRRERALLVAAAAALFALIGGGAG